MRAAFILVLLAAGCSGEVSIAEPSPCAGAADGTRCLGFADEEQRGWAGFCVAGSCAEYVPVRCVVEASSVTTVVQGCDGSGAVTGGYTIEFKHRGEPERCAGVEGEAGFCAPGAACFVLHGIVVVAEGTCAP